MFLRIAFISSDIHKIFLADTEKGIPNRKTKFPQKKNKRHCNVFFCFKMEAIVHRYLRLKNSVKKVDKSSFIRKRHSVPLTANVVCGKQHYPTT